MQCGIMIIINVSLSWQLGIIISWQFAGKGNSVSGRKKGLRGGQEEGQDL